MFVGGFMTKNLKSHRLSSLKNKQSKQSKQFKQSKLSKQSKQYKPPKQLKQAKPSKLTKKLSNLKTLKSKIKLTAKPMKKTNSAKSTKSVKLTKSIKLIDLTKTTLKLTPKISIKSGQETKYKDKAPTVKTIILSKEEKALLMKRIAIILADSRVRQKLIDLGGENALTIVRNFQSYYSDEEISKNLNLKISDVRAALNKLHNEGLVKYNREKNNETGWYSYDWSINVERVERWAVAVTGILPDVLSASDHYLCNACGPTSMINLDSAVMRDFKCVSCSLPLDLIDEKKLLEIVVKAEK